MLICVHITKRVIVRSIDHCFDHYLLKTQQYYNLKIQFSWMDGVRDKYFF